MGKGTVLKKEIKGSNTEKMNLYFFLCKALQATKPPIAKPENCRVSANTN